MFTDPLSITVATVAKSLPRVSVGNLQASYRAADGNLGVTISHTAGGNKERSFVEVRSNKVGADPLDTGRSRAYTARAYAVLENPQNGVGYTTTELEDILKALADLLKSTNFATKFIGKES